MRQRCWMEFLSDYDCKIRYHPGKANVVADDEPHNTQTQTQNSPLPPPIFDPPNPQTNTDPVNEPPRTHPMITRSQSGIWRNAMYDEYNALVKNGTWLLVPRPTGVNMVRSMWLFKHKFHADGTLSRYKARLVANGSSQQLGVDFDETFSPVVKPATIRTVLSLAVSRKWPIHQLDVKNAFLNGDLSETVYMHQPPGFVDARFPNHVCRLQRSLYGLKQAPRAWFQRFGSQVAYLLLYVDDIILMASSTALLQQLIDSLHREFDMTDLGALNYFLCISTVRHSTSLFLSQRKYALQLLERAHMVNYNPSRTPVDTESKLGLDGVPVQDPTMYRSLAGGSSILLLHGTLDLGLHLYASSTTSLVGYTNVDWAGCPSTRSAKSEYRGVANVVAETVWLRNLLREYTLLYRLQLLSTMITLVQVKMEMEIPGSSGVYFITACSYSTDTSNDLMKAQMSPAQDGKRPKVDDQRLDLADDLKEAQDHISSTITSHKTKITTSMYKISHEESKTTS
ncbi:ribonuclease H-like domain-containing protein [Tanacetum coccineum]